MKRAVVAARNWLIWRSGMPGRLRFEALVLMYHRFGADREGTGLARCLFAEQLDYLGRHFLIVPLEQALLPTRGGDRPRVTITIDDGYRSFFEHAWPELQARNLSATVYLPTGFVDEGGWMWQDRNIYLLRHARPALHRLFWRGEEVLLDLRNARRLMKALCDVYEIGRHLDSTGRIEWSDLLARELGLALPVEPPPVYSPMTWNQIRQLHKKGVAFGSHTVNHAILTACDQETARWEIEESRATLAERLGCPIRSFAYPNGDFDPKVRSMVVEAGYGDALATYAGYWSARGDRFAVPRLPAPEGGEVELAHQLWSWWRRFGAPAPQLTSTSP